MMSTRPSIKGGIHHEKKNGISKYALSKGYLEEGAHFLCTHWAKFQLLVAWLSDGCVSILVAQRYFGLSNDPEEMGAAPHGREAA